MPPGLRLIFDLDDALPGDSRPQSPGSGTSTLSTSSPIASRRRTLSHQGVWDVMVMMDESRGSLEASAKQRTDGQIFTLTPPASDRPTPPARHRIAITSARSTHSSHCTQACLPAIYAGPPLRGGPNLAHRPAWRQWPVPRSPSPVSEAPGTAPCKFVGRGRSALSERHSSVPLNLDIECIRTHAASEQISRS